MYKIIWFNSIDSTNKYASENLLYPQNHKTVVAANYQTNGYGKLGRKWYSAEDKGAYFSIVLFPDNNLDELNKITFIAAISIIELLDKENIYAKIKWPNDIYLNNKKIAGILTEVKNIENNKKAVILGIGVNLLHKKNEFPEEITELSTSIFLESKKEILPKEFINNFLEIFDKFYDMWLNNKWQDILLKVKEKLLYLNEKVVVKNNNEIIEGIFQDILINGNIVLKINDHELRKIFSGEIYSMREIII